MSVWLQRLVQSVRHLDIHPLAGRCDPHGPLQRHTMDSWRASDRQRALAGSSRGFVCALIMVKGDWAEFGVSFGFSSWAHHANPCFLCCASGGPEGTWRETEGVSMFSSPWHAKTYEMYDAACRACEKPRAYQNSRRFAIVLGARPQSTSGAQRTDHDDRHSTLSVSPRICVSSRQLTCWSSLELEEFAASFPPAGVRITLWNPSADTLARNRNDFLGTDLRPEYQYLLPDELHTMHLGVRFPTDEHPEGLVRLVR